MANLIIKPTSGGSLILQSQDEAAAVTVGTTGNTTLAGTANALGTVATGNISNTAIVYPAGHVIKTYSQTRTSSSNHDVDEAWTKIDLGGNFDISGITATEGNKLVIQFGGCNFYTAGDNTYQTQIAVSTDGTTPGGIIASSGWYFGTGIGSNTYMPMQFTWIFPVPASFTSKTLSVITRHQTGYPSVSTKFITFADANTPSILPNASLLVQEIQV